MEAEKENAAETLETMNRRETGEATFLDALVEASSTVARGVTAADSGSVAGGQRTDAGIGSLLDDGNDESSLSELGTVDSEAETLRLDDEEDEEKEELASLLSAVPSGAATPLGETGDQLELEGDAVKEDKAEGDPEAEREETESEEAKADAEVLRVKTVEARQALVEIELMFALVRDRVYNYRCKLIDEKIKRIRTRDNRELQDNAEKLRAKRDLRIKLAGTARTLKIEQLHKRYRQDVRIAQSQFYCNKEDLRQRMIAELTAQWFQLHRERRLTDMLVPDYGYLVSPDRAVQIKHQQAYNYEVMLIAGLKRYYGFPAAPALTGVNPGDGSADLELLREADYSRRHLRGSSVPGGCGIGVVGLSGGGGHTFNAGTERKAVKRKLLSSYVKQE